MPFITTSLRVAGPRFLRRSAVVLGLGCAAFSTPSCFGSIEPDTTPTAPEDGPKLGPGEVKCEPPLPDQVDYVTVRAEPSFVVLPTCKGACEQRIVNVTVDPDFCDPTTLTFEDDIQDTAKDAGKDVQLVEYTQGGAIALHQPTVQVSITSGEVEQTATITVGVPGAPATASIVVDVLDPVLPVCSGNVTKKPMKAGDTLRGGDGLFGASIAVPSGADKPNSGSFLWSVAPFDAAMSCGEDMTPDLEGYIPVGPAITFGPEGQVFKRELPMSIPLNPALMPPNARWRHLRVAYTAAAFKKPRTVPVADPRVEKVDDKGAIDFKNGHWQLSFKAPRLGTYQAVVLADAGTKKRIRRLTHRAVIGVSMGGGGAAMVGLRHHDLFDVIAPLGGPVDWTWMLDHIENNHLGGFRPIPKGTQLADIQLAATPCQSSAECKPDETCLGVIASPATAGKCVLLPAAPDPYGHPSTFNTWWFEYPREGTGGRFPRAEYSQIFRDLALMFGNPNGDNLSLGAENLPAGVPPNDKSVLGDHPGEECKVWIDPLEGPDHDKQQAIAESCPHERCAHTLTLNGYFDDEYNPDGTFPVITVCDGSEQNQALSPYANTWHPDGNDYPLEVGLAVDYNGNGVRDELEPMVRAGHERWYDDGDDGTPSSNEAGFSPANPDPAGDDYQAQYNPAGTEGDHRHQDTEKFDDFGLDGVPGTAQQPASGYQNPGDGFDVGEGDKKFTASRGLKRFWEYDPHSVVRQWANSVPGGPLDDAALARIDLWTDGGTRDLFNFEVDAQHLVGAFAARGRDVAYFTDFTMPPGLDPNKPDDFYPPRIVYEDVQGIVMQRYGKIDPAQADLESGSGQHVGKANEIAKRLQTALYFIGSRWPEPELRQLVKNSADKPDPKYETAPATSDDPGAQCEIGGNCTIKFKGRPVGITLPPGYAHAEQQSRHYPVVYMLHGYGQTPEDLEAAIVFLTNWMNGTTDSIDSRLPKVILVYVDGRCRINADGKAECIRGTFFTDSVRADGAQDEAWWLELMDFVDQHYRTMGESEVEWTE